MSDTNPLPGEDELRRQQGKPDAMRCHLCNASKITRSPSTGVIFLCPNCDGITLRKD